jgi:ABC-type Fe3+ transport system permease subunit
MVGGSVALVVSLTDIRARGAFVFCFVLPLMIAPQVTALAWLQVTGTSSPLLNLFGIAPPLGTRNPLYSREGIILLLGLQYAPLVFLTLRAGLRSLPRELIEAGLSSGAGRMTVLRTIVVPVMTPSSASPAATRCCRRSSTSACRGSAPGSCRRWRSCRCSSGPWRSWASWCRTTCCGAGTSA